MIAEAITKKNILFENQHEAVAIFPPATGKGNEVVQALGISNFNAVLIVIGSAGNIDEQLAPRLNQLFGRGISRAAAGANAVIIDGGTEAGIMAMMGEGVAARGYTSNLIGVAPLGKITYPGHAATGTPLEPNHSHFVLVEGKEWGSETAMLFQIAGELISKGPQMPLPDGTINPALSGKVPSLVILAGGGPVTRKEVLQAVRLNLSIIVIKGSGGVADDIAAAVDTAQKTGNKETDDPVMAEIITEGRLQFYNLNQSVKGMELLIIRELGKDNVLMQAWETFADYDLNANLQQKRFDRLQLSIIAIGVIGTAMAIFQQLQAPKYPGTNDLISLSDLWKAGNTGEIFGWIIMRQLLIITPIVLTILVTATNRFKQGSKWLLLRAGAESIKREIFRYRTRSMYYKENPDLQATQKVEFVNPDLQLAQKVEDITRRTMRTEVNSTSLVPYNKEKGFPPYMFAAQGGDDGFSRLSPDRYVEVRLADQLGYYKEKAVALEKQLKILYWLTFIFGGVGTYLAAVDQQVWIALTTAIVAAMGTYMGYRQIDNTLTKYNQAATDLSNVKAWWNALTFAQKLEAGNIDSLVSHTEQVLQAELDGWVQQMQNALAELHKNQAPATEQQAGNVEENKEPQEIINPAENADKPETGTEAKNNSQQTPATDTAVDPPAEDDEPPAGDDAETGNDPDAAATNGTGTNRQNGEDMPESLGEDTGQALPGSRRLPDDALR